jgi:hypothetical protein
MTGANISDPLACCPAGSTCNFYNQYFWQCQPVGYKPSPAPNVTWSSSCTGTKVGGAPAAAGIACDASGCLMHA